MGQNGQFCFFLRINIIESETKICENAKVKDDLIILVYKRE